MNRQSVDIVSCPPFPTRQLIFRKSESQLIIDDIDRRCYTDGYCTPQQLASYYKNEKKHFLTNPVLH